MASSKVFLFALLAFCLAALGLGETQPVIVVSSSQLELNHRSGVVVPAQDFVSLLNSEGSHVFCTVLVDDLRLADFSLYGDAYNPSSSGGLFSNVKSLMSESRSSGVVPSVETASSASLTDMLQAHVSSSRPSLNVMHVRAGSVNDLAELEKEKDAAFLWTVHIPSSSTELDRTDYLTRANMIIGALRERLGADFTLLLTASQAADMETGARSPARHLLAAETAHVASTSGNDGNITLYSFYCRNSSNGSSPNVLLAFREILLGANLSSSSNVSVLRMSKDGQPDDELDGCLGDDELGTKASAFVNLKHEATNMSATLEFRFYKTNGRLSSAEKSSNTSFYWELGIIRVLQDRMSDRGVCYIPPTENDWVIAPQKFSFACQPKRTWMILNRTTSWRTRNNPGAYNDTECMNATDIGLQISIQGLQLQAFTIAPGSASPKGALRPVFFGAPIDCVGYFTGETWMGIIVGLFLISVLFMTSIIFVSMETPDRFDDPKGKNIQVEK